MRSRQATVESVARQGGWLLLCALLNACAAGPECDFRPAAQSATGTQVHIVRHRWHTGVVVPGDGLTGELAFLREWLGDAPYYEIGWGDEGFYKATDIEAGLTLRALFWPTETVMHVVALERHPADYPHTDLASLTFSTTAREQLERAMAASFRRDTQGNVVVMEQGLYGRSLFFLAEGTFWFANTCNTWTARVLEAAGLSPGILPTLSADGMMSRLEQTARHCAE